MPNAFAYAALLLWPLVAIVLFARLRVDKALVWTLMGGYLLLPPVAAIDLPMIPAFDKASIPSLAALAAILALGHRLRPLDGHAVERTLLLLFVLAPFATVLTNLDPLRYGLATLPGLRVYDAIAVLAHQAIHLAPFLAARRVLREEGSLRVLLAALAAAGLLYSLPMLLEVRLSPQLNTWIYGFFQHSFDQMMRSGGYRPIVFLEHGLWVAFFAMTAFVAALALFRAGAAPGRSAWLAAAFYLFVVLVMCKSAASILYALALAPLVIVAGRRLQLLVACVLVIVSLSYPLLRGADLVPVDAMLEQAQAIEEDRAASLRFRFENEDALLERARERPLFGWGIWGRNQIFDPESGRMTSVTDGRWIIVIGTFGWLGYLAEFGLLAFSVLFATMREWRRSGGAGSPLVGPLALILAINMVDMLPNATLTPLTWLVAGALVGHASRLSAPAAARIPAPTTPTPACRPYPIT